MPGKVASITMTVIVIDSPAPLDNIGSGHKINIAVPHVFGKPAINQVKLSIAMITA
jgi:hypothetical protein